MFFSRWKLCLLMFMSSFQVHSARNVVCAVGESVNLKYEPFQGPYSEVSWFYNDTQKILTWTEEETTIFETNLKTRIKFYVQNVTLHIQQLQKEDSSTYKVQTSLKTSRQELSENIRVYVYERLTKPKITSGPKISDNGVCLINVTCSVGKENVTYNWASVGQGANASSEGSILSITWKPGNDVQYICTARNPVSNSFHTINASELCADKTPRVSWELLLVILPSIFNLLFTLNWTQ